MNKLLRTTALVSALTATAPGVWAAPENGAVTSGSATINQAGVVTTINQSSNRAIIRWDKFNVAQPERVEFVQPSSNSITVNRIMDHDPSRIEGSIHANGRIVLINPNGIVFGAGSRVDVGGLVASTSDLDDDNAFMAGGALKFTRPGRADARIINQGHITAREAGLVGLVAPHVENHGIIQARLGKVQLASGDIHTIDFAGDGLIKIEVSDAVTSQSISNTGLIDAEGGEVLITAAQARLAVDALITNTGHIRANSVGGVRGSITITTKGLETDNIARKAGTIINEGVLEAIGDSLNELGGFITVTADRIAFDKFGRADVSGDAGGGTILVGGNYQGRSGLPTAQYVFIGHDAVLTASSRRRGDGGTIILWSDDVTRFYGDAYSRGGNEDGNGGLIEVSSKGVLSYNGFADLRAPKGKTGVLLLDPTDITISSGADTNVSGGSPFAPTIDDGPSVLNVTTLQTALGLASVIVQTRATGSQAGDITVDAAITWGSGNTLTLEAHNNIIVNQAISGGGLTLRAGGDVQLNNTIAGTGALRFEVLNNGNSIGVGDSETGNISLTNADLANITDVWSSITFGSTTQTGAINVGAQTWADNLVFLSNTGSVNINGNQTMGANNFSITTTGGSITFTGGVTQTGAATLDLSSGAGAITTGAANLSRQTGAANITTTTGVITIGAGGITGITGDLTIVTDANPVINGNLTGTGIITIRGNNNTTTMGIGDAQAGTLQLTSAEVARIINGWSSIVLSSATSTAQKNIGALTWNDNLTVLTDTGGISFAGTQTMAANNLTVTATNAAVSLAGRAGSTGALTINTGGGAFLLGATGITSSTGSTININSGAGVINATGAINAGTGSITLTTNGTNAILTSGVVSTAGSVNITTNGGNVTIGGTSTATGGLTVLTSGGNASLGALAASTGGINVQTNGGSITTTGAVSTTTGAQNYSSSGGNITLGGGALSSGSGALTFTTLGGNFQLGPTGITATGSVINIDTDTGFVTATGSISAGTGSITVTADGALGDVSLNGVTATVGGVTITTTGGDVTITGTSTATGGLNINTGGGNASIGAMNTSTGGITVTTSGGSITTTGAVSTTTGTKNLTSSGGAISIGGGAMTSTTGAMTFDTGGGNFSVSAVGIAASTGAPIVITTGNGTITANGIINSGTGNMTLTTDNDIVLGVATALSGTGDLLIRQATTGVGMAIGDAQVGAVNINGTEHGRIAATWNTRTFGRSDSTATMNIGAITLSDTMNILNGTGTVNLNGVFSAAGQTFSITTQVGNINVNSTITQTGTGVMTLDSNGGNITTVGNISNQTGSMTFQSDGGVITIGAGGVTKTTGNMVFNTDADLVLNGTLTGTGNLFIRGLSNTTSMGIGDGQAGTLQLSNAELDLIANTFALRTFGLTTASGAMNIGAYTWQDAVTFNTAGGIMSINGDQNMGANNLIIGTNVNLAINAAIIGTGNLSIAPQGNVTIGLGDGQAGALNLTNAELDFISSSWTNVTFGTTSNSQVMNIGAYTWDNNMTFQSGAGNINIAGATMVGANNLTFALAAELNITGNMSGSGTLNILPQGNSSFSVGDGAGSVPHNNLSGAELDFIQDGWSQIIIGNTASTGTFSVGTYTWRDNLSLRSANGSMGISGNVSMGANNLSILAVGISLTGTLSGTGTLSISSTSPAGTFGIGDGQVGAINLTNTELDNILNGWSLISIGNAAGTGAINIGGYTWRDNVMFETGTGVMTLTGTTAVGSNNLTISTASDPNLTAATITGSGILTIQASAVGTTIGIGTGQTGTIALSDIEIGNFLSGWSEIIFGRLDGTAAINVGARTWQYNMRFRSNTGVITFAGAQNLAERSLVIETNSNLAINAALNGTGTITIKTAAAATIINLNALTTGLALNTADLNNISNGWSQIIIGDENAGAIAVGIGRTWNDNVTFRTNSTITVSAIQTMGANDLTLESNGDVSITVANALAGTGVLRIRGLLPTTTIGVGDGQAGAINLANNDITRITTAWSRIEIGNVLGTGDINIGGVALGNRTMHFLTRGTMYLNGNLTSTVASGTSLVFYTNTAFVNSAAYTITTGGTARYLLYSVQAASDTYGGLTPTNTVNAQSYFSYAPTSVVEVGNVFIYSLGAPKVVYLRADNKNKVYGDAVPVFTYTYIGGLEGADTLESVITGNTLSAVGALTTDNVGVTRVITGGFTTALGYTVSLIDGTLSVTKAPVTVRATAASRVYGDANPAFTVNYIGLKNGEDASVIDVAATASSGATATTVVGAYASGANAISTSGGSDNNYAFNYAQNTLTITAATLTITADNKTKEYADANPALTVSYSGFKNGETSAIVSGLLINTTAVTGSNVGNYAITASGATAANYSVVFVAGNMSVTPAALTITAENKTREYGLANPALTAAYTGFKNGDTSAVVSGLNLVTAANATSNVGSYAITASGATAGNYTITHVNGTLNVTKAMLTVTANNASREYGDANPALSVSYAGFRNAETAAVLDTAPTASTAATILSNVGTYAITASGGVDNNYDFTYVDGTLTVTKAMLTVTANNATREFGLANPALSVSYAGFKNGETSAVIDTAPTASTVAVVGSNVGNYAITASGGVDNNYDFTYVDGTLSITKAMLTVTANNATREYGLVNPALTVSYSGFRNGNTAAVLDIAPTAATTATATTNVGTVAITASGGVDNNYDFTYVDGTLTITKAMLTVTANNASREYGDANPALSVSYAGFRNAETAAVLDTAPTAATTATATTNAGTVAITASGGVDNNYDFTYVDGTLTITKATLTVTANNATREFGLANPAFTVGYAGFKNGETSAVIDTAPTASTVAVVGSNVGSYAITASGGVDNNYNFTYVDGTLTVTKAMLTVTSNNATREYGLVNPALTVSYSGFRNGNTAAVLDTAPTAATTATATTNVGTVAITASGGVDNNYDFTYVDGTLTITKAMLTVTANNASREYGDANPALSVSYAGFRNAETAVVLDTAPTAATTATATTNAGTVAITASGGVDNNYDFTYVDGTLTISKATLTATVQNATREFGLANPAFSIVYTGFKNGETDSVIDTDATASTAATISSNVGNYAITASGGVDNNYNFTYVAGNLTVTKAMLTVTANNQTREFGLANPALTLSYSGFRVGNTAAVLDTGPTATTTAVIGSNVGSYAINVAGGVDNNYDFTYVGGTLNITKAMLTVTMNDVTRWFSDPTPALTAVYSGFRAGNTVAVLDTAPTFSSVGTNPATIPGTYSISASGGVDNNYNFTYVDGIYTVTNDGYVPPPPPAPSTGVSTQVEAINNGRQSVVDYHVPVTEIMVIDLPKNDTLMLTDLIVLPDSVLYDMNVNRISFVLAITESLRSALDNR